VLNGSRCKADAPATAATAARQWSDASTLELWAAVQAVQFDYEKTPKERLVRLTGPAPVIGEPVRIGMSGVEIEGRITNVAGSVLHVKVKATQLKVKAVKTKRVRSA
jgi:hypothetical protein